MKRQKIRKLLLLISFLLFPVTLYYLSPYLVIMGGFEGIITGSLILFILQFVSSLLFGRAFCGWLCPAGALQEYCSKITSKPVKSKKADWIKYFIWAPWLIVIVFALASAGIKGVDPLFMTDHGISVVGIEEYIMYFFVTGLIMVISLIIGRRGMCHSICWMAPFMIFGTKLKDLLHIPSLHLSAKPDKCVGCGLCSKNCTMGLDVTKMVRENRMQNRECILCGECADCCGKNAISLHFGRIDQPVS